MNIATIFIKSFLNKAWKIISWTPSRIWKFIQQPYVLPVIKSLFWLLLTLIFGLLQSIIVFGESYFFVKFDVVQNWQAFIKSGALLFFSTAIQDFI